MHTVYKLIHTEYHRYCRHLKELDEDSRYLRFGYHISDEVIDIVCDRIYKNPLKHKIFVIEDSNEKIVAAGHISTADEPIELAFSVLKKHQGQGMGSALMKRCINWCQNRRIETGCMVCLARNTAIKHLAQKHGILVYESGDVQAELVIPKPDAGSVFSELAEDNLAFLDRVGKTQRNIAKMLTYPLKFL